MVLLIAGARRRRCALVSAVEAERLDANWRTTTTVYRSANGDAGGAGEFLPGARRVAMNYSPQCAIPYVSRVDAGTVEMVRSLGVEVVSAADLIQRFEARLNPRRSKAIGAPPRSCAAMVDETFAEIARRSSVGHAGQRILCPAIRAGAFRRA